MKNITILSALLGLGGCAIYPDYKSNFIEPNIISVQSKGPIDAPKGTCWGRDETTAEIETITYTVQESAEVKDDDGNLTKPAIYRTETIQKIVNPHDIIWFETPCPNIIDDVFITALQKTLKSRGFYQGNATGIMDKSTSLAIRNFQRSLDLNSGQLSLIAARKLGLIPYDRDDIKEF